MGLDKMVPCRKNEVAPNCRWKRETQEKRSAGEGLMPKQGERAISQPASFVWLEAGNQVTECDWHDLNFHKLHQAAIGQRNYLILWIHTTKPNNTRFHTRSLFSRRIIVLGELNNPGRVGIVRCPTASGSPRARRRDGSLGLHEIVEHDPSGWFYFLSSPFWCRLGGSSIFFFPPPTLQNFVLLWVLQVVKRRMVIAAIATKGRRDLRIAGFTVGTAK